MIIMLVIAWVLNQLGGFGAIFCQGVNELFGLHITIAGYYVMFFLGGLVGDLSTRFRFYRGF